MTCCNPVNRMSLTGEAVRAWSCPMNGHADPVPYSEHGDDECWWPFLAFELSSEPADKHVDGSVRTLRVLQPDRVEQHLAAHGATARQQQRFQDVELGARKRYGVAGTVHQRVAAKIEDPLSEAHDVVGHLPRTAPVGSGQDVANPRRKLARVEGLRDIVVRSHLQAGDFVGVGGALSDKDERNHRTRSNPASDHQSVFIGEPKIKKDEIELLFLEQRLGAGGGCGSRHLIAVLLKIGDEQRKDGRIVLDHEQSGAARHQFASIALPSKSQRMSNAPRPSSTLTGRSSLATQFNLSATLFASICCSRCW